MIESRLQLCQPNVEKNTLLLISLSLVWLSVNAIWGLTSPSPTVASQWMSNLAPLGCWFGFSIGILAFIAVASAYFKNQHMLISVSMLMAYAIGVAGAEYIQNWTNPQGLILRRLFYLYAAIPMIGVWVACPKLRTRFPLQIGAWSHRKRHWPPFATVLLISAVGIFFTRLAIDLDLLPDEWWPRPATIVALSTLNGFTEELLFRGLIFPALVISVGLRWGIVLQALLFGFIHLGASEAWIGKLLAAIYLVPIGAYFAFAAFKRKGLAWVACVHALIDVAGLSVLAVSQS